MKKRRMKLRPRFWVLLAIIVVFSISLLVNGQSQEGAKESSGCEVSAIDISAEKDFYLNIPLSCELQEELYEACEEFGVDYYIMVALIDRETKFMNVMGDGGNSYGYCQIQPKWWYGLMVEIGATDLHIPKDNFRVGCAILSRLMEKHNSIEGALVEYNQGYYKGSSTQYSREIIANADRYRA